MCAYHPTTKSWALLIGINFYVQEKCLSGCVRDVKSIASYLRASQKEVKITVLTATTPSITDSYYPAEDPAAWPTSKNIISFLRRVIDEACQGDSVYIHYSGHGTRISVPNEGEDSKSMKLAIVLYEPSAPYKSYFRGSQLSKAIQSLVRKDVLVTLVLDCCFSGSVQRGSHSQTTAIRAVQYSRVDDILQNYMYEARKDLDGGSYRDSRIVPKWMVDPDGYIVLTACGPHEKAEGWNSRVGSAQARLATSW
jgi:hypothetical protein